MNSVKKRIVAATMAALTSATLFATTAFAAGALSKDRNGQTYSYTIGYMYSGNKANTNTREIFSSPNNYDIWCCPVCGRGGGSTGTALEENLYMPCYAYDVAATGGAMNIRYALVRHRHNSGVLSDYKVYIPINEATYSNCYYDYDKTPPSKPTITAPSGWQTKEVTVRFSGATDTGMSLPDSVSTPGNYGSGISHYEYQINGGAWTGCPTNDPTVKITAPGKTTVSARAVDGAGNPSTQIATTTVMIDTVAPNKPTIEAPDGWTNKEVLVTIKDNGDTYSGVKQVEYTLDASGWSLYEKEVGVSEHGIHTVQARVIDQVGHVSETVVKKVQIDKIAPTVEEIEQTVNEDGTQLALTITASDADSGVKGYAVTQSDQTPESDVFGGENQLTVTSNGIYYVWAQDEAGNISQGKELTVTALDRQAPVVTSVETQRTWDAQENWAKITASDENSGVESIGWSSEPDGEIIWESASSSVMVTFQNNGTYYAYARDRAGNISEAVTFEIDRIDKHSPVIDQVEWNRAWSQSKTITVAAHDDESGMGQYAMTRTEERPSEWQTSNVFENITENGTYYLWAKDNVERVSADADEGGETDGPGPEEIVIDTIDRSKPVMDDIIHSSIDNAPEGRFEIPYFNVVDRPELLAHDLADEGWKDSGIKQIEYQFVPQGEEPQAEWLVYDDEDRPAMEKEFTGVVIGRAIDHAGNISDPMEASFLFEQTPPTASDTKTPEWWTNESVQIDLTTDDNLSGVYTITLPDGQIVEETGSTFVVEKNGIYTFQVRDMCGNVLTYPVNVSNIDKIAPVASYVLEPSDWTNQAVTIHVTASDPEPDDGYKASGVASITLPDGEVVEGSQADFVVEKNGTYNFVVTDNGGNTFTLQSEVNNIDVLAPTANYTVEPDTWTNQAVTIHVTASDPEPDDGYKASGVASITLPDGEVVEGSQADFVVEKNGTYNFVVTDNGGNTFVLQSEVSNIDMLAPTANYTVEPDTWTNQAVTIHVTASDPEPDDGYKASGVASITLPDGEVVEGSQADFVVEKNGTYDFVVTDHGGNTFTLHAISGKIDLTVPSVDYHFEPVEGEHPVITEYGKTEYYNYNLKLIAKGEDGGSGIARYEYRVNEGNWVEFDPSQPPQFTEEQISRVTVRVWDFAGNVSGEKVRDIVLDKTAPTGSHTLTPAKDGTVEVNFSADSSICGTGSIVLPDGTVIYGLNNAGFSVSENGEYTFVVWDMCGNRLDYVVTVDSLGVTRDPTENEPEMPEKPESKPTKPEKPTQQITVTPLEPAQILPRLTLLDLAATLLTVLLAALTWIKKKDNSNQDDDDAQEEECETRQPKRVTAAKLTNTVMALLAAILFFVTQPLVWRFRWVDMWTLLFTAVLIVSAVICVYVYKKDEQEEIETEEGENV